MIKMPLPSPLVLLFSLLLSFKSAHHQLYTHIFETFDFETNGPSTHVFLALFQSSGPQDARIHTAFSSQQTGTVGTGRREPT